MITVPHRRFEFQKNYLPKLGLTQVKLIDATNNRFALRRIKSDLLPGLMAQTHCTGLGQGQGTI